MAMKIRIKVEGVLEVAYEGTDPASTLQNGGSALESIKQLITHVAKEAKRIEERAEIDGTND